MREILRVFDIFTYQEKKYCVILVLCMVLGAIFEALGISAILPLIAILGDEDFLSKYFLLKKYLDKIGIEGHVHFIIFAAICLISFYIFKNIYMVWIVKKQVVFVMEKQVIFAKRLMGLYLSKPYIYHLEKNSSILLRNIQSSLVIIFMNMMISIFSLFTEIATASIIWMMLLLIDPFTAIIVASIMLIIIYSVMKIVRKKLNREGEKQNFYAAEFTKCLNQGLGGIKETKVLGKEKYFLDQFYNAYREYGIAQTHFSIINQLPRFFVESAVTIGLLLLIIIKLLLGVSSKDIVPLLGVLALAAFRLMPCANRIINFSTGIRYYLPSFKELYYDLVEVKEKKYNDLNFESHKEKKMEFLHEISVENLSFRYPHGNMNILNNISFKITKGTFVGIVGPSGVGKTTFIDILLGLLEPTEGIVKVDNINIFLNIRRWQEKIAYVPQTIFLLDGSIKENIAMGISEDAIDDMKIVKVLKMAELYEFILSLPEGVETKVGERGVKLSGGQRQRIGIARALYRNPEVLILDEATSALDNETEKNITKTVLKLKGEITIIAIAHRISSLENCDFKINFEKI